MTIEVCISQTAKKRINPKMLLAIKDIIQHNEDLIREMLVLPKNLKINIRSIKGRMHGYYTQYNSTAYLNAKCILGYGFKGLFSTLFHELVHAEQFHEGRLTRVLNSAARRYEYHWNNNYVKYNNGIRRDFDRYEKLPWEVEAFARQDVLLEEFIKRMDIP